MGTRGPECSRIITVADPGIPGGGANIRFCQILPKTAWYQKNLDALGGGGGCPSRPPNSANGIDIMFLAPPSTRPPDPPLRQK